MRLLIFFFLLKLFSEFSSTFSRDTSNTFKWPTVGISVLVRNKAHTLPYFLSSLVELDYPKDRLYIWWVYNLIANVFIIVCRIGSTIWMRPRNNNGWNYECVIHWSAQSSQAALDPRGNCSLRWDSSPTVRRIKPSVVSVEQGIILFHFVYCNDY